MKLDWSKEKLGTYRMLPILSMYGMQVPYFETRVHSPYFPGTSTGKHTCPKILGQDQVCESCNLAADIVAIAHDIRKSPQGNLAAKGYYELARQFEAKNTVIVPIVQRSANKLVWREFSEFAIKTLIDDLIAQFGSVSAGWEAILDPDNGFDIVVSKPDKAYTIRVDAKQSVPLFLPGDKTLMAACTEFVNSLDEEKCRTLHRNVMPADKRLKDVKTWYNIADVGGACGIPFPGEQAYAAAQPTPRGNVMTPERTSTPAPAATGNIFGQGKKPAASGASTPFGKPAQSASPFGASKTNRGATPAGARLEDDEIPF